ncbi:MAG: hypothetical protein V8T10_00350 [Merdibacter sp.]
MDPCSWHIGFNDDAAMLNAPRLYRYLGAKADRQYEEMGYTFVTAFRCLMIYRSEKGAAEVFSDAQTEATAMEKALREERFFVSMPHARSSFCFSSSRFASLLPASCC